MASSGRPAIRETGDERGENRLRRAKRIGATAQDGRIAGHQAEGAGIGGDIGPAFENDADDAQRRRNPLDDEAIWPCPGGEHAADRIGQGGDILQRPGNVLDASGVQRAAVEEGGDDAALLHGGDIDGIGLENVGFAGTNLCRHGVQRRGLLLGRGAGETAGGGTGAPADVGHQVVNGNVSQCGHVQSPRSPFSTRSSR